MAPTRWIESLKLTGVVRSTPGGGFGFSDLVATGAHGTARLSGEFGRDKVDLNAIVDVPQAQVLDPRIAGKAEIVTALTGAPDDLNATLKATLSEGRLLDRKTVETGSFSRAAREFGITQPSASRAIAELEERLGVKLIRGRRGSSPPPTRAKRCSRGRATPSPPSKTPRTRRAGLTGFQEVLRVAPMARGGSRPFSPGFSIATRS